MRQDDFDEQVAALSTLRDPIRRSLYQHVAGQREEVSRDRAARAVGVSRILAAFHLDRLVEAGLLEPIYRRLSGKTGPGAGRTSKLYRRSGREFQLSIPERRYDLLARVFAQALESSSPPGASERLQAAAMQLGSQIGVEAAGRHAGSRPDSAGKLGRGVRLLRAYGFEPLQAGNTIILRNCPFDALTKDHRDLVCGVNLSLMRGFIRGLGKSGLAARLEPGEDRCCVRLQIGANQPSVSSGEEVDDQSRR